MNEHIDSNAKIAMSARILTGKAFYVKTPSCNRFYSKLIRWLSSGMLGAIIYGRPRLGKTSAARWTLAVLTQTLGFISSIEVPCRKQDITNEKAFFQHLLNCANYKLTRKTTAQMRDQLTRTLKTRAARSPLKTVIIFFDEAHHMSEIHYQWLLNISNELDKDGLRLFCLLVGQHDLLRRKHTFIAEDLEEIVGRFMTEDWSFPGIESFEDFENCLKEYDETIFPQEDGIRFPANYVPQAVDTGWTLHSIANPFWQSFQAVWKGSKILDKRMEDMVIPMHYLSSAVIQLLLTASQHDRPDLIFKQEWFDQSVGRSGIKNAIRSLQNKFPNNQMEDRKEKNAIKKSRIEKEPEIIAD